MGGFLGSIGIDIGPGWSTQEIFGKDVAPTIDAGIALVAAYYTGGAALGNYGAAGYLQAGAIWAAPVANMYALNQSMRAISSWKNGPGGGASGGTGGSITPSAIGAGRAQGILLNETSNVDPIPVVYGTRRVGGTRVLCEPSGTNNEYLHIVIALCEGEINQVTAIYIDDVLWTDAKFFGLIAADTFTGTDSQAASTTLISNIPSKWTADHKGSGVAYVYVWAKYDPNAFNGLPNITCDIQGRKVYDPRTSTTAFSNNPALCIRDYLTNTRYGRGISASLIDDASIIEAADYCDEMVTIPTGTQKRYTCDGVVDVGNTAFDNIKSLLTSCRGMLVYSGGSYRLVLDKPETAGFAFTEDNITGSWSISQPGRRSKYNRCTAAFFNPASNWQPDYGISESTAFRTQDNSLLLEAKIDVPFTSDKYRAQQLAGLHLKQSRFGLGVQFTALPEALRCEVGDVVSVTHSTTGWVNKPFRVMQLSLKEEGDVDVTLSEYDATVYDLDTLTAVTSTPQASLPDPFRVAVPADLTLTSGTTELLLTSSGTVISRIKCVWTPPADAFTIVAEIRFKKTADSEWQHTSAPAAEGVLWLDSVQDSQEYNVQIRFISVLGMQSAWVAATAHTVVGKTTPPAIVGTVSYSVQGTGIQLSWADIADADRSRYEIRTTDSGWGGTGYVAYVAAAEYLWKPQASGTYTLYVRAVDTSGNYSTASSTVTVSVASVAAPTVVSYTFADTTLTSASITLNWSDVSPQFGLAHYRVSYGSVVKTINANTIDLPADWLGTRTFTITAHDNAGNVSAALSWAIDKYAPNPASNFRAQVIDNNVLLYWDMPAKTSLPLHDVQLRSGTAWDTATVIGNKAGGFTSLSELAAGYYTYWLAVRDTDGNYSTPVATGVNVSAPPDFVFHGALTSTFTGTPSSATVELGAVVLPVDTTETWASHFSSRGWATPAAQVAAGYPVFIQPADGSGSYQETFDFGTVLPSCQLTVSYAGEVVSGSPVLVWNIETSTDGTTWSPPFGGTSAFAASVQFARVTLTVTEATGTGLYRLTSLGVRSDAKLKNDAGSVSAVSTDASGTLFNFNREFLDITSLNLTASGTAAATAVYNFQDSLISGTYSVTSTVVTVNCTAHDLVAGQYVRLSFTSGTAPIGVYAVASVTNANTFTVNISTANTSGNVSMYPNGARVYLFNSSGVRISGGVSWSAKGY